MSNKILHHKIFLNALRTAIIFIVGFLGYELLKTLELEWNHSLPNNEVEHFARRKSVHFILIFLTDLLILYFIVLLFDIHL